METWMEVRKGGWMDGWMVEPVEGLLTAIKNPQKTYKYIFEGREDGSPKVPLFSQFQQAMQQKIISKKLFKRRKKYCVDWRSIH